MPERNWNKNKHLSLCKLPLKSSRCFKKNTIIMPSPTSYIIITQNASCLDSKCILKILHPQRSSGVLVCHVGQVMSPSSTENWALGVSYSTLGSLAPSWLACVSSWSWWASWQGCILWNTEIPQCIAAIDIYYTPVYNCGIQMTTYT